MIIDKKKGSAFLVHRKHQPHMNSPWIVGGGIPFDILDAEQAASKIFKRETLLNVSPKRFEIINGGKTIWYAWSNREQEPRDAPLRYSAYSFAPQLNESERKNVIKNLDSEEYYPESGLIEVTKDDLKDYSKFHPALYNLFMNYFKIFARNG